MNEEESPYREGIIPPDQKDIDEANQITSKPPSLWEKVRSSKLLRAVGVGAGITAGVSAIPTEAHAETAIIQPAPQRLESVISPIFTPRLQEVRKQEEAVTDEFIRIDLNDPNLDLSQPIEYTSADKKIVITLKNGQKRAGILTSPTTFAESGSLYEYNCKFIDLEVNKQRLANMTPLEIDKEKSTWVIYPGSNIWQDGNTFQIKLIDPDNPEISEQNPTVLTIAVKYPHKV